MTRSRGLGKLQRAILDALPAHELAQHPGVYDLRRLRVALAQEWGKTYPRRDKYGRLSGFHLESAFTTCFSRAVSTLIYQRKLLNPRCGQLAGIWDCGRWRLPYVRLTDKR